MTKAPKFLDAGKVFILKQDADGILVADALFYARKDERPDLICVLPQPMIKASKTSTAGPPNPTSVISTIRDSRRWPSAPSPRAKYPAQQHQPH